MLARTRQFLGLSLAASVVFGVALFNGCSSSEDATPAKKKDAGSDVSQDGKGGTGGTAGGGTGATGGDANPNCKSSGSNCANNGECCLNSCDPNLHVCINPPGGCLGQGDSCSKATDCCGLSCVGGACAGACTSDNQACSTNDECCSGTCAAGDAGGNVCIPLNGSCKTSGNTCTANTDCCSKLCKGGNCALQVSFCTQTGDICSANGQCCTGICTIASGATVGTCTQPIAPGTTGCLGAGEVCGAGANVIDGGVVLSDAGVPACGGECCSRSCAPYGPTGVMVCQPPSGCHPTGELCTQDSDCCGAPGVPGGNGSVHCSKAAGEPTGRCDNGNACRPNGAVCKLAVSSCNAENNCCAGNVNQDPTVCQQDLLGIPRCTGVGACADGGSLAGQECASSADCCGLPCLPNLNAGDGGSPFICGTSCVASGGNCTTDADCCAGLPCVAPPGSTQGICGTINIPDAGTGGAGGAESGTGGTGGSCAFYGQVCTQASDCCNNVPCTNGHCVFPIQ